MPTRPLAALALAVLVLAGLAPGAATATAPAIIDDESLMHDCQQIITGPAAVDTDHLTSDRVVRLDVLVLLDVEEGADIARTSDPEERAAAMDALVERAADLLDVGRTSYAPLDIDLAYREFRLLAPLDATGAPRDRTDDAQEIIDLAKAELGGRRPAGFDIVYVLTDLDIQLPSLGNIVAGLADCIGGVTYDDRAFAVGEIAEELPFGPYTFYKDVTAKIAAHEIGHLMGGHHHYQSCGDAVVGASANGEVGPCTLMTNAVDFQSLPFSALNGVVVRGHAVEWAAANDGP
jgi:hypothetical protein